MSNKLISRSFNNIKKTNGFLQKTSSNSDKLHDEFLWLDAMKKNIYIPAVSEIEKGYEIEFKEGSNLGEVFWILGKDEKKRVLDLYFDFIVKNINGKNNNHLSELMSKKMEDRRETIISLFPELRHYVDEYNGDIKNVLKTVSSLDGVMHGDLFFGNTIYDGTQIYLIDPRGSKKYGIYGNVYYDIIKLAHSTIYQYDGVIFGYDTSKHKEWISKYFFKQAKEIFGLSKREILIGLFNLFSTMIPLHSDSEIRQKRFRDIAIEIGEKLWKK